MKLTPAQHAMLQVLGALFILLAPIAHFLNDSVSVGTKIKLFKIPRRHMEDCFGDDRSIIVLFSPDGSTRIDETPIPIQCIPDEIGLMMKYRQERCVYIAPSNTTPFQDLVLLKDKIETASTGIHVLSFGLKNSRIVLRIIQVAASSFRIG